MVDLPVGVPARVVGVLPEVAPTLSAHGIRTGSVLSVEGDAPLRGPRIVRLGPARVALGRAVATGVRVMWVGPEPGRPR